WVSRGLAGGRLPEPHNPVTAHGQRGPAVGTESREVHLTRVDQGGADTFPGNRVPELRLFVAGGESSSTVRAEGHSVYRFRVGEDRTGRLAREQIPKADVLVGGEQDRLAAVAVDRAPARLGLRRQRDHAARADRLAGGGF